MTVLEKISSFFKRPKEKAEAQQPKTAEAPKKKAGKTSQQSTGTT